MTQTASTRVPGAPPLAFLKANAVVHLDAVAADVVDLQWRLFSITKQALLVALQAMDAGAQHGTIRTVKAGINAAGLVVTPFVTCRPPWCGHTAFCGARTWPPPPLTALPSSIAPTLRTAHPAGHSFHSRTPSLAHPPPSSSPVAAPFAQLAAQQPFPPQSPALSNLKSAQCSGRRPVASVRRHSPPHSAGAAPQCNATHPCGRAGRSP